MLISENHLYPSRMVMIMTDVALLAAIVKTTLLEISRQQHALGEGLLSAAPADKAGAPNKSVQYLLDGSEYLLKLAKQCDALIQSTSSGVPKD